MALSSRCRYLLKTTMGPAYSKELADAVDAASEVITSEIADNAVTAPKIASNSLETRHFQALSINVGAMGVNSIDSDQYVDGSIDNDHLSDNCVDSDQLADGSIDPEHFSSGAVNLASLDSGVKPSHIVKYAGESTLAAADVEISVAGVLATDQVFVQSMNALPADVSIQSAYTTTDTITVNCSGDASTTGLQYQVIRAVS